MGKVTYLGGKSPGAQKPENYGNQVGPNYLQWGEQTGLLYYPPTDTYYEDPKYKADYYQQHGLNPDGSIYTEPPKQPGMLDTIAPFAAAAGAMTLGQSALKPDFWSGWGNVLGGGGSSTPATAGSTGTSAAGASAATAGAPAPGVPVATEAGAESPGFLSSLWGSGGGAAEAAPTEGWLGGGSALPTAAGIAAGAYTGFEQGKGLWDAAKGKDISGIGQAALALPTFGASLLWNPIKDKLGFGDQDKWQTEGNRLKDLADKGAYIPQNLIDSMPTGGRSFDSMQVTSLPADFIGRDSSGNWVNNKFNQSRDVADLRGEDIVNYSALAEKDPDWFNKPLDQRIAFANQLLQNGAVTEHHGTIDIDWDKGGAMSTPPPATTTTPGKYPPKGTRLSPGIYADGKGGSNRA